MQVIRQGTEDRKMKTLSEIDFIAETQRIGNVSKNVAKKVVAFFKFQGEKGNFEDVVKAMCSQFNRRKSIMVWGGLYNIYTQEERYKVLEERVLGHTYKHNPETIAQYINLPTLWIQVKDIQAIQKLKTGNMILRLLLKAKQTTNFYIDKILCQEKEDGSVFNEHVESVNGDVYYIYYVGNTE